MGRQTISLFFQKDVMKADGYDETEWHLKDWLHIYDCPFYGTHIKRKRF
jgi:hypothetical protein